MQHERYRGCVKNVVIKNVYENVGKYLSTSSVHGIYNLVDFDIDTEICDCIRASLHVHDGTDVYKLIGAACNHVCTRFDRCFCL